MIILSMYFGAHCSSPAHLFHCIGGDLEEFNELGAAVDAVSGQQDPGTGVHYPGRQGVRCKRIIVKVITKEYCYKTGTPFLEVTFPFNLTCMSVGLLVCA